MATSIYFCTSCGEPQEEIGQFCTNCGAPVDASSVPAGAAPAAGPPPAPARPGATVRLPENGSGPASAAVGATTAIPPRAARSGRLGVAGKAATLARGISPRLLAVGAVLLVLMLAGVGMLARGLPLIASKGADRIVTQTVSRSGDTILVLMRSDGSGKVTLVDEPGASQNNSVPNSFSVSYVGDAPFSDIPIRWNGASGAAILPEQQRILFWYPTLDGMEIRNANLDGGDVVTLAEAALVTGMTVPLHGDKVLLSEREENNGRLSLVNLRGQTTTLVQNAVEVDGTISPDGKHIAYWQRDEDGRYTLTIVDENGANPVEVERDTRNVSVNFSSDSNKLFISRTEDDGSSLLVANADGQNPIVLSRNAEGGRGDVANGRLIYEVRANGAANLFTSDLNGDDRVEIVRGADNLIWGLMPDRKQIIFSQQRNGRYTLQTSDFKHEQVQDLKRSDGLMFWRNLDNGRVLVTRYSANGYGGLVTLSTMKPDGTDEQVLKRDLDLSSLDAQGDTIVVGGQTNGRGALHLFGGQEPVTLDDEADGYSNVRIAPDGRILYTANFKSGPVTYVIDRSGKQKKLLTEDAIIVATGF